MNKIVFFLFIFFVSFTGLAQNTSFVVDSNDYASINSYNGIQVSNAYDLWIRGTGTMNLPTWRMSVRVTGSITNGSQIFPANKLSLLPTATSGQLNGNVLPSITQIGMPLKTVLQQGQEIFLVPQSQAGLYNSPAGGVGAYYYYHVFFDLKVEGGAYLGNFALWSEFHVPLEFKFYNQNNQVIGSVNKVYRLQISNLSGTPPITPQYSIKIGANAANGLLDLKTKQDYLQGKSVTYTNGIIVNANTNYQIKVTSLQPDLTSKGGNKLPLKTIQLTLSPENGNQGKITPILLSNTPQSVATGGSTNGQVSYGITYRTQANDLNLITSKMDEYSTTLQFEILPQ